MTGMDQFFDFMRPDEVADTFGISLHTLAGWQVLSKGQGHVKLGQRVRYERHVVEVGPGFWTVIRKVLCVRSSVVEDILDGRDSEEANVVCA